MIDFLKILISDDSLIKQIYSNPLLLWYNKLERLSHFDFETISSRETKIFRGVMFCFYGGKLEILFRPHYLFNDNQHNANDFTINNCMSLLKDFFTTMDLLEHLNKMKILNIEFGLNIVSPIDCKELVTFVSYHNKNEFKNDPGLIYSKKSYSESKNGKGNKYKIIKAYHKGLQFPEFCDANTFRFEVKSKKSSYINSLGIFTISDLFCRCVYEKISEAIIKEFDEVLILGNSKICTNLTSKENKQLNKYLNPYNWYVIKQQHRNQFSKTKKRFFKLLDKSGVNTHTEVRCVLVEKLNCLL